MSQSIPDFLSLTCVGEILTTRSRQVLIYVTKETPLEICLDKLLKYSILSVPIYDSDKKEFVGMVDMLDVARYLILQPYFANNESIGSDFFSQYVFSSQIVGALLKEIETTQQVNIAPLQEPLKDLMEKMISSGHHRALVKAMDESGNDKYEIISQTDVLQFLNDHLDKIGNIGNQMVKSLNIIQHPQTLSSKEKTLQGIQQLTEQKKNALAVVDEHGKLISQLSTSNLRGLKGESLEDVLLPIAEFVKKRENIRDRPITCPEDASLHEVMKAALISKTHRVWITNEKGMPTGVISFSQIMSAFLKQT